ncbi:LysR family transcriptional regulator [Uliginosibacterium sediminicola]|uniref:LysR family transcriptional regulator n=1 Tax=Uliginosibacterium sediminicola TaxID=2024550 RepID=A0ABU9YXZ9_9RHOO
MTRTTDWDLYRCFLAVLQEGSLSAAARALGLTQPTTGRQIAALEAQLGVVLFTRSQSGLTPTDAALALRGHVEAMHNIAASVERVAGGFGQAVSGSVRISASEVVGTEWLPPILAALRRDHPALEIELVLSNRVQDLVQREVDIAVRMLPPQQDVLLATRVAAVHLGLYARSDYLARRGLPAQIADLAQHDLIGFDVETPFLRAARAGYPIWARENFALRCDSDLAQLALIRAGAGVGICQVGVARRDAQLVRLLPEALDIQLDTWVAMHADLRNSPRCRVTFDALVSGLRAALAMAP